jgi:hypothetical protein
VRPQKISHEVSSVADMVVPGTQMVMAGTDMAVMGTDLVADMVVADMQ